MKKPNIVSTILSVAACKLTRFVLRKTGRGGTAIPGIVAMKVCPNILAAVSDGMKIVVVTGTNGKTTTCNMIEHALTSAGYTLASCEVSRLPQNTVGISEEDSGKLARLLDMLDESDDVQNVWHNAEDME